MAATLWNRCVHVGDVLGMSAVMVAQAAAGVADSLDMDTGVLSRERLGAMERLSGCLTKRFASARKRRRWLIETRSELDGVSPIQMVLRGEAERVLDFCEAEEVLAEIEPAPVRDGPRVLLA